MSTPRGRPADEGRRDRLLAAITEDLLAHGLRSATLRSLAEHANSSPRMLLYEFGTRDELLCAALEAVRRRQADIVARELERTSSPAEALRALWRWQADNPGYPRLWTQARAMITLGELPPEAYASTQYDQLLGALGAPREDLLLIAATFAGLHQALLDGVPREHCDKALEAFLGIVRER